MLVTLLFVNLSYTIIGRQVIPIMLFIFALFYKDVRVFQLTWAFAFIRELADLSAQLVIGGTLGGSISIIDYCNNDFRSCSFCTSWYDCFW